MLIQLSADEVADAERLAKATSDKWNSKVGHYGNSPDRHRTGKLGEVALEKWFREQNIEAESLYRDIEDEKKADFKVVNPEIRVELKTWSAYSWEDLGRCVAVGQASTVGEKADLIIWCILRITQDATAIEIAGWSTVGEVVAAPKVWTGPQGKKVHNHQLPLRKIRPYQSLLQRLREGE